MGQLDGPALRLADRHRSCRTMYRQTTSVPGTASRPLECPNRLFRYLVRTQLRSVGPYPRFPEYHADFLERVPSSHQPDLRLLLHGSRIVRVYMTLGMDLLRSADLLGCAPG